MTQRQGMTVLDKTAPQHPRAGHASVVPEPRRPHLSPVPNPAEQAAFEDRLVDLLVRINEGWLHRQEAGR